MEIEPLTHERMADVATLVARLQADSAHHIAYLSVERDVIAAELAGLEPDPLAAGAVLLDGDAVAGALLAEWDSEPPRAWWYGPFADHSGTAWQEAADGLYAACVDRLPDAVSQEELAADAEHAGIAGFAARHGFTQEEGSSVLHLPEVPLGADSGDFVMTVERSVSDEVSALHDQCFPGTHRTGADLVGEDRRLIVARTGKGLAGYALAEVQPGGEGYLDFVGVPPDARRRGVGRALVVAASRVVADEGCLSMHLTVPETNTAARALYEGLGFTEERVLRPYRKGFSLGSTVGP